MISASFTCDGGHFLLQGETEKANVTTFCNHIL